MEEWDVLPAFEFYDFLAVYRIEPGIIECAILGNDGKGDTL